MKIGKQTVIDADGRTFAAWGLTPEGVALVLVVGSERLTVTMDPREAEEIGCGGIFAARMVAAQMAARQGEPAHGGGRILGADGMPAGEVRRG
jgi:apolipoprotein N-acyltransferase